MSRVTWNRFLIKKNCW